MNIFINTYVTTMGLVLTLPSNSSVHQWYREFIIDYEFRFNIDLILMLPNRLTKFASSYP